MSLRTTYPLTRINSDLKVDSSQQKILNQHWEKFSGNEFVDALITGANNDFTSRFNANFLHLAFVYVITETVGDYPYAYFTEKTWKAMATGRPFLLVGAKHSLKQLRLWGFKTFTCWWDEDYDNKTTVVDRIQSITQILIDLKKQNLHKLEQMMQDTIAHNQQHLVEFRRRNLESLTVQLESL